MANAVLSFDALDQNGAKEVFCPSQEFQRYEEESKWKQTHLFGPMDWGDFDYLYSDYDFYQEKSLEKGIPLPNGQQPTSEFLMSDDMQPDAFPEIIQELQETMKIDAGIDCIKKSMDTETPEIHETKKEKAHPISSASLELLNSYRTEHKILIGEMVQELAKEEQCHVVLGRDLSTEEVMRVAGAHFIQFSEKLDDDLSMLRHPFGSPLSTLMDEDAKDVELAQLLLASAEKIGNQQYDRASKLLTQCKYMSSNVGNPVQRVVYHFAEALHEKISRETRRISSKGPNYVYGRKPDLDEATIGPHPAVLASHQMLPFGQVIQFTAVQAIIDKVALAKRIHLVDLGIRIGMQWTILMQALAERHTCPVELLKISAIGASQEKIEDIGKRLVSFANTLNLPFTFKSVIVSDMKDLKKDMFELEPEEVVGVYASTVLSKMIFRPDCLENLMRVIRSLNPCIMAITEIDANHNSPSFVKRFIEALFFFSAWFDCLDTCMSENDHNRMSLEDDFFSEGIRNIVATEGSERIVRHVQVDVWRSYFARFGFMEIELNHLSLYQASLLLKQFSSGSSCTLDMNGKSLSIGWKGTPLYFVSAWKLKWRD